MGDCDGVAMIILSEMGDCSDDVMLRRGEHGIWMKCPTLLLFGLCDDIDYYILMLNPICWKLRSVLTVWSYSVLA
jgi:hypothetical protein